MAKQRTPSKVRQLTLCRKLFARVKGGQVCFPELRLRGKWLADSGFRSGHVVDIACEQGKLTITLAKEQPFIGVTPTDDRTRS